MKIRVGLVLLAAVGVVWLSGCQSSAAKAEEPEAEVKPVARSVEKVEVTEPEETAKPKTRTIRMRDAETGEIITKEVPVDGTTSRRTTSSTRTTATSKPAEGPFEMTWSEKCSVQRAFNATNRVLYEALGLKKVYRSGSSKYFQEPESDYISATLKAHSTIGVQFDVNIFLQSADMTSLTIKSTSPTQPKHVLEKHTLFIRSQISEAIQHQPAQSDETAVVKNKSDSIILDRSLGQVYDLLYQWAGKWGFDREGSEGDRYSYQFLSYRTGSGIRFNFRMRIIDTNKTKLEIEVDSAEGKDEYAAIRRSLDDVLQGGDGVDLASYTDTKLLGHSIGDVADTLRVWADENNLKLSSDRNDVFYARCYFYTSSGIRFSFTMRLVDSDQTRLEISADRYEGKDEFPVVLKSLEEALAELEKPAGAVEDAAADTAVRED